MSDMGYIQFDSLVTDYIQGQPAPGDPVKQAALQEQYAIMNQQIAKQPGSIPQSYLQYGQPNPTAEAPKGQVDGNLPIIGWTAQKDTGSPFRPYTPTPRGIDWTSDVNPVGAGPYDMNGVVASWAFDRDNQAPIGGAVFDGYSEVPNPNVVPMDNQSLVEDAEY